MRDETGRLRAFRRGIWPVVAALLSGGCVGPGVGESELPEDAPVHLEECLDGATVVDSKVPDNVRERATWHFEESAGDWNAVPFPSMGPVSLAPAEGSLRVSLGERNRLPGGDGYIGLIGVELPGWQRDEWAEVLVEARTDGVK